jgi:hypothetical protein
MKNYRIIKGKKIHVNQLASMSRLKTVKNNTIGSKLVTVKTGKDTSIECVQQNGVNYYRANFTGTHKSLHIAGNLYTVSEKENELGLHFSLVPTISWEHKKHPQPKNLRKKYKKKYYFKGTHTIRKIIKYPSDYTTYTKALKIGDKVYTEGVFVNHTLPKMNKVQYMEKLVEHKLAKWERKNVCPEAMFTEDVEKWKHERETMKERFRDFVVSIYDKLHLTGRFVVAENKYTEEKVAEIKDVDGEGHHINDLPKTSKLIKKAQKITNETKAKRQNLVATNLKDHKKQKGRIILPQAA